MTVHPFANVGSPTFVTLMPACGFCTVNPVTVTVVAPTGTDSDIVLLVVDVEQVFVNRPSVHGAGAPA